MQTIVSGLYNHRYHYNQAQLKRLQQIIDHSIQVYASVFNVNIVFKYPLNWQFQSRTNESYVSKFIKSLKAQLRAYNHRQSKMGYQRSNTLYFVRCTEIGNHNAPYHAYHHHVSLFFNGHVFNTCGNFNLLCHEQST